MDQLLDIKDLTVEFNTDNGPVTVIDRVSLSIRKGQTLGLVGESGSGKSVTAMSTIRLIPCPPGRITNGSVYFNDRELLTMPRDEIRRIRGAHVSVVFQEPMTALSPLHRIGRQLVETLRFHRDIRKRDAWSCSLEWMKKVGIPAAEERMFSYPHELSGGMRQRVMIAMALMLEPELIIADEPTTALDVTIQAQILELMSSMRKADTALWLITHDMGVIRELCTHVAVMYAGQIVETGTCNEIFNNPLHPYTKALLASIPSLEGNADRLPVIHGQVPSPRNYPAGCRFADRCPKCFDPCRSTAPTEKEIYTRMVRCHLFAQSTGTVPRHSG